MYIVFTINLYSNTLNTGNIWKYDVTIDIINVCNNNMF